MKENITKVIKDALDNEHNLSKIRVDLINQGYLEAEIDDALSSLFRLIQQKRQKKFGIETKKFITKEFFDRIGFGFSSSQYLNILLFQTGAGLLIIGLINGLKAILTTLYASFLDDYAKAGTKMFFFGSSLLLALSFILVIIGRYVESTPLFILAMVLLAIGVASYGESYKKILRRSIESQKKSFVLQKISIYGLVITGFSLFASAFIMDKYEVIGGDITLFGITFIIQGYMIALLISAISFILAGMILMFVNARGEILIIKKKSELTNYLRKLRIYFSKFSGNRVFLVLIIATGITSAIQTLGNAYYGIYIYNYMQNDGFGGFLNVAVVFLIAVLTSFFAPRVTRKNAIEYGKFPMLVFGTLLMAIMPLSFYYNPNLLSISMGTVLGIMGGAIIGVAQGLLTLDLLRVDERTAYFASSNIWVTIPYLIVIPIGSFIATKGLELLFLSLALVLTFVVMPLYFLIVILHHKKEKI